MTRGVHLIAELNSCDSSRLNDPKFVESSVRIAANLGHVTILHGYFHQFEPEGVTGFLCLSESHIAIHTWPTQKYAAVDIYTCGEKSLPQVILNSLSEAFGAEEVRVNRVERGGIEFTGKSLS